MQTAEYIKCVCCSTKGMLLGTPSLPPSQRSTQWQRDGPEAHTGHSNAAVNAFLWSAHSPTAAEKQPRTHEREDLTRRRGGEVKWGRECV